jgi:adenylylsulfate kinase
MIYWFTGQPGAGKTTLAEWMFTSHPSKAIIIDGDDIRKLFNNKDYSETGRRKNIENVQMIAKFLHHKALIPIVAMVSPYRDQREEFKLEMGKDITEIYVYTTENRGRNEYHVENYEPPIDNFISINTTHDNSYESFEKIKQQLKYEK